MNIVATKAVRRNGSFEKYFLPCFPTASSFVLQNYVKSASTGSGKSRKSPAEFSDGICGQGRSQKHS